MVESSSVGGVLFSSDRAPQLLPGVGLHPSYQQSVLINLPTVASIDLQVVQIVNCLHFYFLAFLIDLGY